MYASSTFFLNDTAAMNFTKRLTLVRPGMGECNTVNVLSSLWKAAPSTSGGYISVLTGDSYLVWVLQTTNLDKC
jgi:hypothetical protein